MAALALLFLVLCNSPVVFLVNPGFRTEITQIGLDYVRQVGVPVLVNELKSISIPDQSGSAHVPVIGGIDYSFTNIRLTQFSIASSALKTVASTGIEISLAGVSIAASANWHYSNHGWIHISDSGSADVSASDVSLTAVVNLGVDSSGHPTVSDKSCSFVIGNLDVHFHGGASWLYNLFADNIADGLKGSMEKSVCSAATNAINTEANKSLSTLPLLQKVSSDAEINLALTQPPIFNSTYMQTLHKCDFIYTPDPSDPPFQPPPLPPTNAIASFSMLSVWITDYVANTAGFVYQKAGVLKINITQSMIPSNPLFSLDTNSFKEFAPGLYSKYPNKALQILVNATSAPYINITSSFINFTAPGEAVFYVLVDNATKVEAFTLGVVMRATVRAALAKSGTQEIVTANATYLKSDISLVSTNVGDIKAASFEVLVNFVSHIVLIPKLNKYGATGFAVPVIDGVSFVNPVLMQGPGYVQIATNVSYTPSVHQAEKQFRYVHLDELKDEKEFV
ncbi:bactericidal permeability-increasing protein-like [Oscarella lobularis]|uniref:bactericidal permeability-increasing protein-like n=1 Tax=Oscarella lobularis TaxID=121494 RepID=UPI003313E8A2